MPFSGRSYLARLMGGVGCQLVELQREHTPSGSATRPASVFFMLSHADPERHE